MDLIRIENNGFISITTLHLSIPNKSFSQQTTTTFRKEEHPSFVYRYIAYVPVIAKTVADESGSLSLPNCNAKLRRRDVIKGSREIVRIRIRVIRAPGLKIETRIVQTVVAEGWFFSLGLDD